MITIARENVFDVHRPPLLTCKEHVLVQDNVPAKQVGREPEQR